MNDYNHNWFGSSICPTLRGLSSRENASIRQFSSYHTGIAMFALGDGSVRSLRNSLDTTSLNILGGARDGGVNPNID